MRRRDRGAPEAAGSRTVFLHRCFALAPVNRLFSIARNALTNTFRHARAGRVEVELDFGVDSIQLSVSDDGVGLPDEYAQRGHGFAGMRTDTEAMGGRLIVETLGRRGGTTLTCTIPYEQAAEGDMISSDKPIRVMLVDDHPIVRMGLRGILEPSRDFEVVGEASDGVEAVETSERLEPDVIVMDVMMPRQDGVEACREIMEKLPDTQVLMLTASTEEDAVVEAVAAGATGYLQKYSGGKELEEAVRAIAEGRLRIPDKTLRRTLAMIRGELWEKTRRGSSALTTRERELLTLFAGGEPYARIADAR